MRPAKPCAGRKRKKEPTPTPPHNQKRGHTDQPPHTLQARLLLQTCTGLLTDSPNRCIPRAYRPTPDPKLGKQVQNKNENRAQAKNKALKEEGKQSTQTKGKKRQKKASWAFFTKGGHSSGGGKHRSPPKSEPSQNYMWTTRPCKKKACKHTKATHTHTATGRERHIAHTISFFFSEGGTLESLPG